MLGTVTLDSIEFVCLSKSFLESLSQGSKRPAEKNPAVLEIIKVMNEILLVQEKFLFRNRLQVEQPSASRGFPAL